MKKILLLLMMLPLVVLSQKPPVKGGAKPAAVNEKLVFSSSAFVKAGVIKVNGKNYSVKISKNQSTGETGSVVSFDPPALPELKIPAEITDVAVADLNLDRQDELMVLTNGRGTWKDITIYRLKDARVATVPFWFKPYDGFGWNPGDGSRKMCDAEIYYQPAAKKLKILSTNITQKYNFCNQTFLFNW